MDTYKARELLRATSTLRHIEKMPLSERKEAQRTWAKTIAQRPELVGNAVMNLLNGNYGEGEMMLAQRILKSPRMNRVAALAQLAAGFEWSVPMRMASDAWKKLDEHQKAVLADNVQDAIDDAESLANE